MKCPRYFELRNILASDLSERRETHSARVVPIDGPVISLIAARSGGRANYEQARDTERDNNCCEPDWRFHGEPPRPILPLVSPTSDGILHSTVLPRVELYKTLGERYPVMHS
jgi:hypothetical protein